MRFIVKLQRRDNNNTFVADMFLQVVVPARKFDSDPD